MTLPANSTFLPVLDDLLSPDFRPVLLPAQTPQTPTDVILFGGAKFVTNACGNLLNSKVAREEAKLRVPVKPKQTTRFQNNRAGHSLDNSHAAAKIQRWWRSKKASSLDIDAERAKHSIRHSRTEDHIRYLEGEVTRLKSALSSERKIRSLQLEAIRSLWSQVQRILTSEQAAATSNMMTRSVPNGFSSDIHTADGKCAPMSMSMNAALGSNTMNTSVSGADSMMSCSCTAEVQSLRENFSQEMNQLRAMINRLTNQKDDIKIQQESVDPVAKTVDSSVGSSQKRPATLDLGPNNPNAGNEEAGEQITDYASQMASKLVDDAVEEK